MQLQGLIETPEQSSTKFKPALAGGPEDDRHGHASGYAVVNIIITAIIQFLTFMLLTRCRYLTQSTISRSDTEIAKHGE